MENGKQYVYVNHFTLGENQQPVNKKTTPLLPGYFPLIHSYYVFPFSIFQLQIIKYKAGQPHRHSRNFVSDGALGAQNVSDRGSAYMDYTGRSGDVRAH